MSYDKPFVHKDGSGSLFKNEYKTESTHSDYKGSIMLNGKEYWLDGYVKEGKKGKFFNIRIGKEKQPKGFVAKGSDELPATQFEDDVPF